MTAEKWDAFTHRQPGQTSLVVATFARASGMAGRRAIEKTRADARRLQRVHSRSESAIRATNQADQKGKAEND